MLSLKFTNVALGVSDFVLTFAMSDLTPVRLSEVCPLNWFENDHFENWPFSLV